MFIVWRQKPITSDKRVELFVERDSYTGDRYLTCDLPSWHEGSFYCTHTGSGRVSHTPLLVMTCRTGDRVAQKLLRRFPSIRSCCIKDGFVRSAWWARIDDWLRFLLENTTEAEHKYLVRDRTAVLKKLRTVVPLPTLAMRTRWEAYVAECDRKRKAEWEARQESSREYFRRQEERRREDEQRRQEEFHRTWQSPFGSPTLGAWWRVLGVQAHASLEEVKSAYRALVKKHHPDCGGDPEQFHRVQEAYEVFERLTGERV